MPASDTGPCGVSMEPKIGMNSAGSCDSVVSTNSGFSDDSMEHLSAEERACLMFLEETIESLEAEDDSGVSNDEPDSSSSECRIKIAHLSQTKPEELLFHENPNKVGKDHKPDALLTPAPLDIANGTTEPAIAQSNHMDDLPPSFIPEPPVKTSSGSKTKDSPQTQTDSKPNQKNDECEILMGLIPPPSDFMDEPALPPSEPTRPPDPCQPQFQAQAQSQAQPRAQLKEQNQPHQPQPTPQLKTQPPAQNIIITPLENPTIAPPPGFEGQAENEKTQRTVPVSSRGPLSPSELDKLRKKASLKKSPEKAPLEQKTLSNKTDFSISCTDGRPVIPLEQSESKSPPVVAPKPKKFPSNIMLKGQKDSGPGHSHVSSGERLMDPDLVHKEALKKLGLLRPDEVDSPPSLCSSPPHRIPPPHPFNTSSSTTIPSEDTVQAQPKCVVVETQGKTDLLSPISSISEKGGRESQKGSYSKPFEIKSASMERPRVSFQSNPADQSASQEKSLEKSNVELSPRQLQRSRPRHVSVGSQQDLGVDQPSNSSKEPDIRRSLRSSPPHPPSHPSTDSQKPPRTHGMISVVFTPNSKNGDDRMQALRKLGLIKD